MPEEYILPKGSISAYYLTPEGKVVNIIDPDFYMISGMNLDTVSQMVEDNLDSLNDIICQ